MLTIAPALPRDRQANILVLGAHSDDVEIGCGATLIRLAAERSGALVHWVVFSAVGPREHEAKASAEEFLAAFADHRVTTHGFRDAYFPQQLSEIKDAFEALKSQIAPDLILTHHGLDRHQDHKVISDLTWNTFRNHMILEYEIPKYDGGLGDPNVFVPVTREQCDRKIDALLRHFQTQRNKHWFSHDLFAGLMRVRGLEANSPSGLAEAFHCRKATLAFGTQDQ
jgi:LmbE family N-acetylglucosaminyl deacetylase